MPGPSPAAAFLDTNVLLYLVSSDATKADRAESLLADGGVISVQVLNEFANVGRRKAGLSWDEVIDILDLIRRRCRVLELTAELHDVGVSLARRFSLSVYDAMIVAAALEAGSATHYSEDMQHGLRIDRALTILNPFLR